MPRHAYDPNCRGCRPVILDLTTGVPLTDSHPAMRAVAKLYDALPAGDKVKWHDFTCRNSRTAGVLEFVGRFQAAMQRAMAAIEQADLS